MGLDLGSLLISISTSTCFLLSPKSRLELVLGCITVIKRRNEFLYQLILSTLNSRIARVFQDGGVHPKTKLMKKIIKNVRMKKRMRRY